MKYFSMSRILKDCILIPSGISVSNSGDCLVVSAGANSVKIRIPFEVSVGEGKVVIQNNSLGADILSTYFVLSFFYLFCRHNYLLYSK